MLLSFAQANDWYTAKSSRHWQMCIFQVIRSTVPCTRIFSFTGICQDNVRAAGDREELCFKFSNDCRFHSGRVKMCTTWLCVILVLWITKTSWRLLSESKKLNSRSAGTGQLEEQLSTWLSKFTRYAISYFASARAYDISLTKSDNNELTVSKCWYLSNRDNEYYFFPSLASWRY